MIFEKVKNALAQQFELDPESITADTNLIDDLGADSLDILQLLMRFEDQYGLVIPDQALATFKKVADVVSYLEKMQEDQGISLQ